MRPPKTDFIFKIRIKSTMIEKKTIKTDTRNKRTNKKNVDGHLPKFYPQ